MRIRQKVQEMLPQLSSATLTGRLQTIRTEIWRCGENDFAFRCRVLERDTVALDNGAGKFGA